MAIQLVDLLQKLHDVGYIHCDLKPDNIMIGDFTKDEKLMNKLYLIDFGISQSYLEANGEHLPFKRDVPFKGNVIFSSKNAFD
jgi:casein kinase 1